MRKVNKETLYKIIGLNYKMSPEEISNLNPFQQSAMCRWLNSDEADVIHFHNMEEYMQWKNSG